MATLGQRIIEALGGVTSASLEEQLNRAYESGYYDGNDDPASGDIAGGGFGYRRVTSGTLRDFHKATHDQILNTIWTLWQSSLIAKRAMTLKRDHLVGTGAEFETDDENLQEILTEFVDNNGLSERLPEFCLQLRLLGEQIYPAFVREADGRVTLGYLDPGSVEKIVTHPDNAMERWMVICKAPLAGKKKAYRIIREDREFVEDDKVTEATHENKLVMHNQTTLQKWELETLKDLDIKEYSGSVFFFPINCLSNQPRGYSDLVQAADWIDQAEETLFAMAEREQMAGYFSFDVTLTGADDATVRARAKELRANPPSKGSVNVHNDAEEWKMWAPDLKQYASIASFTGQITFIMGGLGYPVSWYGYGDDTNRSTLQEQATPSEKTLEHDQNQFERMMLFIARFVADQAEISGAYSPDTAVSNEVRFPLPPIRAEKAMAEMLQTFAPLVNSLVMAEDARLLSHATAARVVQTTLNDLGLDINPEDEAAAIEEEEADKEQQNNDKLNGMMQQQQQPGQPNGRDGQVVVMNGNA